MKLKVTREVTFKTEDFCIGDKITVNLHRYGKHRATVQKITDKEIIFLFDDLITRKPMHYSDSCEGGFDKSALSHWLKYDLYSEFPRKMQASISRVTLPTYGEIFGHDDFYEEYIQPDEDEQWELMKNPQNRVAALPDEDFTRWWWLRNPTKEEVSSALFADVSGIGDATFHAASDSCGVRPEFRLVR